MVSPSATTDDQTWKLRWAIFAHRETTFQVLTIFGTLPAATTPNQLVDWTCTQHDLVYSLAAFGDVAQAKQVDRNGNVNSWLGDGYGWDIASLDQDSNLTRTKFDTMGKPLEVINALSQQYD